MRKTKSIPSKLLFCFLTLILLVSSFLTACTSKTNITVKTSPKQTSVVTTSVVSSTGTTETALPMITPVPASGVVNLPPRSSLKLSDLRIQSCLGQTPVSGDGSFKVQESGDGVAAVGLTDNQGKTILVGYVDASISNGNISADTTAVWLLCRAFMCLFPGEFSRADLIKLISDTNEAKQLGKVKPTVYCRHCFPQNFIKEITNNNYFNNYY